MTLALANKLAVAGQSLFNDSRVPGSFNLYSICIIFYSQVQLFIESKLFDTVWPFLELNHSAQCGAPIWVDQLRYEQKWLYVFYRHVIQHLVVLYKPKGAILFFNEEYWGGHGGF
jgi:hypothetical protein